MNIALVPSSFANPHRPPRPGPQGQAPVRALDILKRRSASHDRHVGCGRQYQCCCAGLPVCDYVLWRPIPVWHAERSEASASQQKLLLRPLHVQVGGGQATKDPAASGMNLHGCCADGSDSPGLDGTQDMSTESERQRDGCVIGLVCSSPSISVRKPSHSVGTLGKADVPHHRSASPLQVIPPFSPSHHPSSEKPGSLPKPSLRTPASSARTPFVPQYERQPATLWLPIATNAQNRRAVTRSEIFSCQSLILGSHSHSPVSPLPSRPIMGGNSL